MKLIFELTTEQFKKNFTDFIANRVSINDSYLLTSNDLTLTVENEGTEVTIDKIIVSCELPETAEYTDDSNEEENSGSGSEGSGNESNNEESGSGEG